MTWETDAATLKDKLLAGTPPAGVTLTGWSITPDPDDIGTNETIGYYEDFDVTDGTNLLSVPDGVILTTGTFVDGNDNHANYCNDADAFTGESGDYGDEDVAAMYRQDIRPDVYDGASLTISFTSGPLIGGLRFNVLLASDEFAFYAAPAPTPADPEQQSAVSCYPDTFGAFLDRRAFAFAKDNAGNAVLINVAEQVINLNNNTWPGADHNVTNYCGELTAENYTNVDFNIEYDGIAARQVSPGNWAPLTLSVPLAPTGQGEEHTLKLALTDVTDNILDTAAFVSGLEFIECHCPPSDADGDGDVDLADFNNGFQACFNGPNRPYKLDANVCFCMDADHDADIDLADFNVFQNCFNGPNRPPKCDTQWCQSKDSDSELAAASGGSSEVVFSLHSPSNGQVIAAGTPLEWSVTVRATGLDADVAGCAFDLELRHDSEDGALAKVALPPPTFATPFSDGSAVWSVSGPSHRPLGTLGGLGDAFPVPWSVESAVRLAALSAETATMADVGCVVSAGVIDTKALPPGRYVLVLRPVNANVLRSAETLAGEVVGNFAAAARAVAGARSVAFEITK